MKRNTKYRSSRRELYCKISPEYRLVRNGIFLLSHPLTSIFLVVDFAAMRDAVLKLGGDPDKINPICPSDLVIDHSVQVDFSGSPDALAKNQDLEFERNKERFTFLKWGAKAFNNMLIIPPGSGIVHQVNLEYLARVVMADKRSDGSKILFPDSVVGTDSHTYEPKYYFHPKHELSFSIF